MEILLHINSLLKHFILLLTVTHHVHLFATSMVYSFRVAQITKQPVTTATHDPSTPHDPHNIVALFFEQFREKYDGTNQNFVGGLASYICDIDPYYIRVDAAVSNIHASLDQVTTFSGTETDDILFTAGRNFVINNHATVTLSGLFGIPTHKIYRLQHVDFGYSQVGLGLQVDGLYAFDDQNAIVYGGRYIYFVPRTAQDIFANDYRFTIGNVGDLLLAYKNNWTAKHGIEVGYTARWRFGAHICPNLDDTVEKTNYTRNNFYFVYKYRFPLHHTHHRLLFYASYGFDQKPKTFGNKHIVTLWTSWTVNF